MSKSVKVGILIVAGVVLFGLGLFLIGTSKQLFTHHYSIYTEFNNISSITKGANVRVSGMDASTVDNIEIPSTPSDKFRIKLKVDQKFRHIIRKDSLFVVPDAVASGGGTYNLENGAVDLRGKLATHASLSGLLTGWKSILAIPLDPFFRKERAGSVLTVTMTGAFSHPQVKLQL